MVDPRFFKVKRLSDLLDHLQYCRYIIYKVETMDDNTEHFRILAGRLYWEGIVNTDSKIYKELIEILSLKGIEVEKTMDLNSMAERFVS